MKYIVPTVLALAGLATVSFAQNTLPALQPDLVLGFSTTSPSTGNLTNYEIDLGSMANYVNLAPLTQTDLSGYISATDLSNTYGASWASANTLKWGAAATVGAASATLNGVVEAAKTTWTTQAGQVLAAGPWGATTNPTALYFGSSGGTLNSRYLAIQPMVTGAGTGSLAVAQTNSTNTGLANVAAFVAAANSGSWTSQKTNGATEFAMPGATTQFLNMSASQFSVVDLFQYGSGTTTPGSYIGSLELGANGSLFFTNFEPTAVPEPSTYALILGVAALGFVMLRRRTQALALE